MANSFYTPILTLEDTPDADFANTLGAVLQTANPITYYRVKAVIDGEVLELSRLARRPKNLRGTRVFVHLLDLHETVEAARPVKEEPPPVPTTRTKIEPLSAERLSALRVHVNRFLGHLEFGPAHKGEQTAIIIILLTLGLTPDQVVQAIQSFGFEEFKSKGTVIQRRRGLRIRGWEMNFCRKHGITVDLDAII